MVPHGWILLVQYITTCMSHTHTHTHTHTHIYIPLKRNHLCGTMGLIIIYPNTSLKTFGQNIHSLRNPQVCVCVYVCDSTHFVLSKVRTLGGWFSEPLLWGGSKGIFPSNKIPLTQTLGHSSVHMIVGKFLHRSFSRGWGAGWVGAGEWRSASEGLVGVRGQKPSCNCTAIDVAGGEKKRQQHFK